MATTTTETQPGETGAGSEGRRPLVLALVLVLATIVAYIPSMQGGFIWDDDQYVTENEHLRTLEGLPRVWIPRETPQYYPLVFTTFWVEYQLWGARPFGFHVVNVLLHVASALLVWRIALRLRLPGAWMIAAVFALHPVHVESVAWITERKNVLSGTFYLLAFLAYLRFDEERSRDTSWDETPRPWGWYALALATFLCALLSKTVTASLPVVLGLVMLYRGQRPTLARIWPLVPMVVLGVILGLHTSHLEKSHVLATGAAFDFTFWERAEIAGQALLFYPWKLLVPLDLIFIYPRWEVGPVSAGSLWPWAVLLAAGVAVTVAAWRGHRGPFVALAFYGISIFPAIGFFNIYPMLFSFVADHFQYLASLGIIALVVGAAARAFGRHRSAPYVAGGVLAVLGGLTWAQGWWYHDFEDGNLWERTLARNPDAWMAHGHLAIIKGGRGDFEAAEWHLGRALEINPTSGRVHANIAAFHRSQGQLEEALASYMRAAELTDFFSIHVGRTLIELGRPDEAEPWIVQGLEEDPTEHTARIWLAERLAARGRYEEAAGHLQTLLELDRGHMGAHRLLGDITVRLGRPRLAEPHYRNALAAADDVTERVTALKRLATLLTRMAQAEPLKAREAVTLAEEAARLAAGGDPDALAVLAGAYAAVGRRADAIAAAEQGLALARELGREPLVRALEQMLQRLRASG
jgi:tetratricopeptide (TPR) repeat protein